MWKTNSSRKTGEGNSILPDCHGSLPLANTISQRLKRWSGLWRPPDSPIQVRHAISTVFWWPRSGVVSWAKPSILSFGVHGNDNCWAYLYSMQGTLLTRNSLIRFWLIALLIIRFMINRTRVSLQGGSDKRLLKNDANIYIYADLPIWNFHRRINFNFCPYSIGLPTPRYHGPSVIDSWFAPASTFYSYFRMIHHGFAFKSRDSQLLDSRAPIQLNGIGVSFFVFLFFMISEV